MLTAVFLYAPLVAASWSAHTMACCTADHCPITAHHHHAKTPAPQNSRMDCEHDMSEMMNCSMSCCQNPEQPLVTAVAFVLPDLAFASVPVSVANASENLQSIEILRSAKPLPPPPRFAHAL